MSGSDGGTNGETAAAASPPPAPPPPPPQPPNNGTTSSVGGDLSSSALSSKRSGSRPPIDLRSEDEILSSLDKYRPSNFDRPGPSGSETSDINDIRDFYCNVGTKHRALKRFNMMNGAGNNLQPFGGGGMGMEDDFRPRNNNGRRMSRTQFDDQDDEDYYGQQQQQLQQQQMPRQRRFSNSYQRQEDDYDQPMHQQQRGGGGRYLRQQSEDYQQPQQHQQYGRQNSFNGSANGRNQYDNGNAAPPDLDDSTRFLLDKARAARSNPVWDEELERGQERLPSRFGGGGGRGPEPSVVHEGSGGRRAYNWEEDSFYTVGPSQGGGGGDQRGQQSQPTDSMLSSKTRSMLDKLKESTAALNGLNQGASASRPYDAYDPDMNNLRPDAYLSSQEFQPRSGRQQPPRGGNEPQTRQRKPSRFLRDSSLSMRQKSPSPPPSYYPGGSSVHLLADDILSSTSRSRTSDQDRYGGSGGGRFSSRCDEPEPSYGGRRVSRFDDSPPREERRGRGGYEAPRGRSRMQQDESPPPPTQRSAGRRDDDEDFDSMIADLKKKTTGRDMYNVLGKIEGREITPPEPEDSGRGGGRAYNRSNSGRSRYGEEDDRGDRWGRGGGGGGGYQVESPGFQYGSLARNGGGGYGRQNSGEPDDYPRRRVSNYM